ncbi:MAG: ABC transporter ATP-binding protein [Eubacteriales bacterium]|nr:ABC transporter ATP-binding protein [Eubacteriales bacterium]
MEKTKKVSPLLYCGKYKRLIYLGCGLSGAAAIINMIPYICIWKVTEIMFQNYGDLSRAEGMVRYGWTAFWAAIAGIVIYCSGLMCTHIAAFNTARRMRSLALHHLVKLPLGYFGANASGKLRRIIDENAGFTETYIAHRLPDFAGAIVAPVAMLIILFYFDWRLGLASLVPIVIGFVAMGIMMGGASENIVEYQRALDAMNGEAVEYVRGMPVVKTFQQSVYSLRRFMKTIDDYAGFAIGYCHSFRLGKSIYDVAINSIYAVLIPGAIIFTGACASMGEFQNTFINIIFYILFTPYLTVLMTRIMFTSEDSMVAQLAVEKIRDLLSEKPLPEPEPETAKAGQSSFDIAFHNVSFAYDPKDGNVLNDISLNIPSGKTVALVGPSGGGKSTLAALIPRFYDVSAGSITIGGTDVRELPTEELMRKVSFVFQQNRLFKESLLDNIKEARPEASMEEVLHAAQTAQCGDIIEKMPQGLDTVVGTKGVYLSGGEAQRIALARAVLKDAPIVLLDEATAFADPENEYRIQRAFSELTRGKTVLMIAHRLSTVKNADCIYVINGGRVEESGTHDVLLAKGGLYAKMWNDYQTAASWRIKSRGTAGEEAQA